MNLRLTAIRCLHRLAKQIDPYANVVNVNIHMSRPDDTIYHRINENLILGGFLETVNQSGHKVHIRISDPLGEGAVMSSINRLPELKTLIEKKEVDHGINP